MAARKPADRRLAPDRRAARRRQDGRCPAPDPRRPGGPGLPAHDLAVADDARCVGPAQWQGRRHRDALRPATPAGGHSLMRITVLTGGATPERAVAFASASQIVAALRSRKHDVRVVDLAGSLMDERAERELLGGAVGLTPPVVDALAEREQRMLSEGLAALEAVRNAEVLFLAVHGGALEGGTLQAVLDVIGVPYTGSGPLASALAMDKDLAKRLFRSTGVPVPAWFMAPPLT